MWNFSLKDVTIEPVVFLYMLAIYLNIPTDEALLYRQVCSKFYNQSLCTSMTHRVSLPSNVESTIQKSTSIYLIYLNFVYSIPSIFVTIICSSCSEKYSHRLPMVFANLGCILATFVNLWISISHSPFFLQYFFLANFFISLFGSTSTMFSIVYHYISSITTSENRTIRIALLESSLLFGSTLGLILSGILLDAINFAMIFVLIIFLHLLNILYIIFYVPEVIDIRHETFSWKSFSQTLCIGKDIRHSFRILFQPREFHQRRFLLLALAGLLCSVLTSIGESSIVYLYLKRSPLAFSQSLYGLFRGLKAFGLGLGLLIFLPILRYYFHINDMTCAILGTLSKCATDFLYALDHSTTLIFFIPLVGMFSSYVVVGVRSYLSKLCHREEEGRIFSILASLESVDALIGSILFNLLYSSSISTSPSLVFLLACALHLLTLPLFSYILFNDRRENDEIPDLSMNLNDNSSFYFSYSIPIEDDRWLIYRSNQFDTNENEIRSSN